MRWTATSCPKFESYSVRGVASLLESRGFAKEAVHAARVVGTVLPVKTNNYVTEQLIDWSAPLEDPLFILNFPQREMLLPHHFCAVERAMEGGATSAETKETVFRVRSELNPHPAGQREKNIPVLKDGTPLPGVQHKYADTVLFFPSQGQTCHAYCSFCFRWPQFVGMNELKFAAREIDTLVRYLQEKPLVTDVLFTGGDPMIMKAAILKNYVEPLISGAVPHLRTIRIGSKALSYWPYRFINDPDADELLRLFEKITASGIHLSFMAHFNHPRELSTPAVEHAISRIRSTGAQIRTQSPILRKINDSAELWSEMWRKQVMLGCIPYYMFVVRDTGAQHYFGISLVEAQKIYRKAYQSVSGLARTVRGPCMSAGPGKVQVLGPVDAGEERYLALRFLRGRKPEWVGRPFLAKYDREAMWLNELTPPSGARFFFQEATAA